MSRERAAEGCAVLLRLAAVNFAKHLGDPVEDDDDRAGAARDRALMKAAVAYANALAKGKKGNVGK